MAEQEMAGAVLRHHSGGIRGLNAYAQELDAAIALARAAISTQAQPAAGEAIPQHVLKRLSLAINGMLTQFGMDEDEDSKPTFARAREAWAEAQHLIQDSEEARAKRQGYEWWDRLCALPRWSFAINRDAVRRVADKSGNWVEFSAAQQIVDDAQAEINVLRATPQPARVAEPCATGCQLAIDYGFNPAEHSCSGRCGLAEPVRQAGEKCGWCCGSGRFSDHACRFCAGKGAGSVFSAPQQAQGSESEAVAIVQETAGYWKARALAAEAKLGSESGEALCEAFKAAVAEFPVAVQSNILDSWARGESYSFKLFVAGRHPAANDQRDAARQPLTDDEADDTCMDAFDRESRIACVRIIERAHGIGIESDRTTTAQAKTGEPT